MFVSLSPAPIPAVDHSGSDDSGGKGVTTLLSSSQSKSLRFRNAFTLIRPVIGGQSPRESTNLKA